MRNLKPGNIKAVLFFLLCFAACVMCFGQSDKAAAPNLDSILSKVDRKFKGNEDSLMNNLYALSKEDSALKKALSEYRLFGLQHRMKTLEWNLTSSRIIFWCVIFLVFSGIVFAGLQFYRSIYRVQKAGDPVVSLATEMEASMKGIKINSPVLGVIILVLSLLFFYLYLVYVYPITEIF